MNQIKKYLRCRPHLEVNKFKKTLNVKLLLFNSALANVYVTNFPSIISLTSQ